MSKHAFVADGFIQPKAPPPTTVGATGWLRENLFRGPLNTVVTIVIILGLALLIPVIVQWGLLEATFSAKSLAECRDKGEGACWAVIVERFDQFIYGFYPAEIRWRPNMAFVLMLLAFAFALFDNLPWSRVTLPAALQGPALLGALAAIFLVIAVVFGMVSLAGLVVIAILFATISDEAWARLRPAGLAFSAVYPVVAYFLIWGGSLWPIIDVLLAAGAAYLAYSASERNVPKTPWIPLAGVVAGLLVFAYLAYGMLEYLFTVEFSSATLSSMVGVLTIVLAVIAVVALGIVGGTAWQQREANRDYTSMTIAVGVFVVLVMRLFLTSGEGENGLQLEPVQSKDLGGFLLATIIGVAGITLSLPIGILLALGRRSGLVFIQTVCIVFIEFIRGVPLITLLFVASSVLAYFFPPESNLDLILRVVIMVTAFASAYMAEVVRGGLASLPPGQYEAADAMGLNYWQATRLIIMPQALKVAIPNIVSTFIGLFKDTTLVVVIGLLDPIGLISTTRADAAWNGIIWEFYVFVGFFFFIACFAMSRYSLYLERKLATDRR
ncbi:MAG: amino acid ABC transporter permease [Pseudomonadota bacterium]